MADATTPLATTGMGMSALPFQLTSGQLQQLLAGAQPTSAQQWGALIPAVMGLFGQGSQYKQASNIADIADPFRQQRPGYQEQLNAFMADPSSIFKDPAYLAAKQQGLEADQRYWGATQPGNIGGVMGDLQKYATTFAYGAEQNKFNQLSQLAGVNAGSPAAAASLLEKATADSGTGAGIGALASLLGPLLSGGASPASVVQQLMQLLGGGGNTGGAGLTPDQLNYTGGSSIAGGGDYYTTPMDTGTNMDTFYQNFPDLTSGFDYSSIFSAIGS